MGDNGYRLVPHGGHFAALEQPALLAEHLVSFLLDGPQSHDILLVVVDVPSMSKSHDDDHEHVVLDGVDDAVVTNSNTKPRSALKSLRSRWARILGEQGDGTLDATAALGIELA